MSSEVVEASSANKASTAEQRRYIIAAFESAAAELKNETLQKLRAFTAKFEAIDKDNFSELFEFGHFIEFAGFVKKVHDRAIEILINVQPMLTKLHQTRTVFRENAYFDFFL